MPDTSTYVLFVAAALVLLIVPGPSVLYIVARSVEGGRTAGLVSVLGVQTGAMVHIAFATLGISAILASSAVAFSVVKWLGAAYLVWLGLRRIFGRAEGEDEVAVEPARLARVLAGRDRQHPQPEDGLVLPRFPTPVRRPRAQRGVDPDPAARRYIRRPRPVLRRPLRPALGYGERLAATQGEGHGLQAGTALRLGRHPDSPGRCRRSFG